MTEAGHLNAKQPNCTCLTCGKRFYCKPAQIRLRNGGKYCSRACKYANPLNFKHGSDHPNWKGSAASRQQGRVRAQKAYELGDCERCGAEATDRHHVDGNTHNNAPENVQALCRRCHMLVDGRLDALRKAATRKLTATQAREIRARSLAGETRAGLAGEFGVSRATVRNIARGETWTDI